MQWHGTLMQQVITSTRIVKMCSHQTIWPGFNGLMHNVLEPGTHKQAHKHLRVYRWLTARLWYLQYVTSEDTVVLH